VKHAALLVMLAPAVALAEDKPEPTVVQAGEANLESTAQRQGLVFTLAAGGGVTLGFGVNDSTGTGGSAVIRLAHVATPHSLVILEIAGGGLLHQVKMGDETTTYVNQVTNFLVGAQAYVNQALWFRLAGGLGRYKGDEVLLTPQRRGDIKLAGPAISVGAGVDFVRLKRVRIGAELMATGMINREGLLSSGGFMVGVSID
jgi:hypothetical protein